MKQKVQDGIRGRAIRVRMWGEWTMDVGRKAEMRKANERKNARRMQEARASKCERGGWKMDM